MKRWLGSALWLFAACAGTETGNPSFTGALGYDAYSSSSKIALQGSALEGTDALEVQSAWLVLGNVSFVTQAECPSKAPVEHPVPGIGAGDHVAGQAPQSELMLDSGRYCAVLLPIAPADSVKPDIPAELVGHSLWVRGRLPDGRAFELRSALDRALSLRAAENFELDAAHPDVVIGFDVGIWLEGIDTLQVEADADGSILADETHNPELLDRFESQVLKGVGLFRDRDGDGLMDASPTLLARGTPETD